MIRALAKSWSSKVDPRPVFLRVSKQRTPAAMCGHGRVSALLVLPAHMCRMGGCEGGPVYLPRGDQVFERCGEVCYAFGCHLVGSVGVCME